LSYVGLPLQLFGKGSLFGPYTPLQQLDILAENTTKSYVVGSTNSLLLSQKDKYADILINLDDNTLTICSQPLKAALALTVPDRRWIDFLTQTVNETWDEQNPGRPNTLGYAGSEEFLRLQFEEYLLALLSAVKYKQFMDSHRSDVSKPQPIFTDIEGDPAAEFGAEWVKAWTRTENFRMFNKFTDNHIFDIVEPHHPCSGGLTIEDVQRRLASQVAELHLDERFHSGREALAKNFAEGQKKVSTAFNNLWNDIEVMREAQRKKAQEQRAAAVAADGSLSTTTNGPKHYSSVRNLKAPDFSQAQAGLQAAGKSAGAYLSSWGAWAAEKRKTGWGRSSGGSQTNTPAPSSPVLDKGEKRKASVSSFSTANEKNKSIEALVAPSIAAANSLGQERPMTEEPGHELSDVKARR
jgi:Transport protein Avl9